MDCWSPMHAMEAYLHTVQLCKEYCCNLESSSTSSSSSNLIEPKSMEYIAALAAGNQAQLTVDIGTGGASPATMALAIASRHTGGRLVCIRDGQQSLDNTKARMEQLGLGDAADFQLGRPCEAIERLRKVDFAVIDRSVEGCLEVFKAMDMNPKGAIVVVSNLFQQGGRERGNSYWQVVRGRGGCQSMVLPIGQGLEVTRIGRIGGARGSHLVSRSTPRRTFLVHDEFAG